MSTYFTGKVKKLCDSYVRARTEKLVPSPPCWRHLTASRSISLVCIETKLGGGTLTTKTAHVRRALELRHTSVLVIAFHKFESMQSSVENIQFAVQTYPHTHGHGGEYYPQC